MAAPPYIRYFFKDIVSDVGCNHAVYLKMTEMVQQVYHQPIDYFDLRNKQEQLKNIDLHLIYCEDDETVPFEKGMELLDSYPNAHFVQARGFGHYKIISHEEISRYLLKHSESQVKELAIA